MWFLMFCVLVLSLTFGRSSSFFAADSPGWGLFALKDISQLSPLGWRGLCAEPFASKPGSHAWVLQGKERTPPVQCMYDTQTSKLQWWSSAAECSTFITDICLVISSTAERTWWCFQSICCVSPHRGPNAAWRWAHWPTQEPPVLKHRYSLRIWDPYVDISRCHPFSGRLLGDHNRI